MRAHKIVETLLQNLARSEATLAPISDANVKLPLHFGMIRLDLTGDGQVSEDETLWKLYAALSGNSNVSAEKAREFFICFDRGDVHWLRGYCHLLMSMCEIYLAHDSRDMFDRTASTIIFHRRVDSPYKFLSHGKKVHGMGAPVISTLSTSLPLNSHPELACPSNHSEWKQHCITWKRRWRRAKSRGNGLWPRPMTTTSGFPIPGKLG